MSTMNLLLLSLLIIQNVTSYFENFKNGVNTQFVKDKVKCGPGNEVHNLNSLNGGDPRGSTGTPGSYFNSEHPKIDVNKLDSLLNTSNYLNPLQYLLKSSESMKIFASSASQLSPYRLSRKLSDDSSNYNDREDDERDESFLETNGSDKNNDKDEDGEEKDQFGDEKDESFLETNGSDKTNDKDEDGEDKDQFDDDNEESFLEKDEYDDISDSDNDHDTESDDFSGDHEESFLEKDEYDEASDNENDEFYDEDAESFLEQEEYEDVSDNENDEFDEDHGESFLEKEDGNDDSNEDNGKEYKEEYQNKMADDEYPDEYVGKDDLNNSTMENTESGNGNGGNGKGSNAKELKNKENESFLEQNVNGHTEEENEKHSTFLSSYLDDDNTEDKYNEEIYDEASFLEEGSYSHNDDEESDDTFDEYYEDSFLERGKLGTPYSDYYEEDADEEDAKEANEDAFDNHHLNEISTTNDVHSFIQKDMGFIDELIDDNETIKEAVKKGSKKAMKQSMNKLNLLDDEDFEDKESFSDDEINGFMEENMDTSKLDAKKAKTTLRTPEKKKNVTNAEGKGSNSTTAANATTTTNAANATTKGKSETSKKQTDLSNEDLFNDELTEEVIADSYEEGGNLETEEGENLTNAFDDKLLDQGVNENTLLNDNNMIFNAKMVPHKKRELYISPHKHTSATDNKNGKHHAADVDALDKKLRAHELLELENGEGNFVRLAGVNSASLQSVHRVYVKFGGLAVPPVLCWNLAHSHNSQNSQHSQRTLERQSTSRRNRFCPSPLIGSNSVIVETEEVDVDLNGGKSSSSVSFLSSVVFLLIGLLCFTN